MSCKSLFSNTFFLLLLLLMISSCENRQKSPVDKHFSADVIIYGGNSSAVIAAVQVARMGKEVILVSPDKHLGGLSASGLGWTDTGNKAVIGGLARDFYHRLYLHYQQDSAWKWQDRSEYGNKGQGNVAIDGENRTMWIFEPHAAELVFDQLVSEYKIPVYRESYLDRERGVEMQEGAIVSIRTLDGTRFKGKVFIDATYEGDLMAASGVTYTVGRESTDQYGEEWNGVQTGVLHHGHHFKSDISPFVIPGDPSSGVLPRISTDDPGQYGAGDHRLQAYCFRLCLTDHPGNRVAISRPGDYDSTQYELLRRVFESGWREVFHKFDPIPNHKTDVNNHGPFSSDKQMLLVQQVHQHAQSHGNAMASLLTARAASARRSIRRSTPNTNPSNDC